MNEPADPSREIVRATLLVEGKVQGVFYRAAAQGEAMRLGLVGEVRNLPEGWVEVIVEGERQQVEEFLAWSRKGPSGARVDSVDIRWSAARGEFRTFIVTR